MDFHIPVRGTKDQRRAKGEQWLKQRITKALRSSGRRVIRDRYADIQFHVPRRIVKCFGTQPREQLQASAERYTREAGVRARIFVFQTTFHGVRFISITPERP